MKLRIRTECQQYSIIDDEMGADIKPVRKLEVEPRTSQAHPKSIEEPSKFDYYSISTCVRDPCIEASMICTPSVVGYDSHDAMEPMEGALLIAL